MPDISKCANKDCPMRNMCYRYRVKPSEFMQTYADFKPAYAGNIVQCTAFWSIEGYAEDSLLPVDVEQPNLFKED